MLSWQQQHGTLADLQWTMWWTYLVSMPPSYNKTSVFPTTMTPSHRWRPDASPDLFFIPILLFIKIYSDMTLWPHLVKYNLNLGFFKKIRIADGKILGPLLKLLEKSFFLSLCISFFLSLDIRGVVMEETGQGLCVWEEHQATLFEEAMAAMKKKKDR